MTCIHCKGTLEKGTAPFSVDRNGYHVHWDALPAWVCTQCGEPLFEGAEVDRIQRAVGGRKRAPRAVLGFLPFDPAGGGAPAAKPAERLWARAPAV